MKPYLLFDAGGTLLYPHANVTSQVCREHGYDLSVDAFMHGFYGAIYQYDVGLGRQADTSWLLRLAAVALEHAGVPTSASDALAQEAINRCGSAHYWTYSRSWVQMALERLSATGYRMSVVSNSDGTVEQQLRDLNYTRYFERVFDSAIVGVEKPDPRIFTYALEELGLSADQCIYIGDIYHIDVVGANGVGMAGVHIDPYGRYKGWPGYHVANVGDYAEQLLSGALTIDNPLLYPHRHYIDMDAPGA